MIKIFAAFAILTVMISIGSVYSLKQATYNLEEKKRDIRAKILMDREEIKVLKAEMSYLSRPERLERLSRRHLVLAATTTNQLAQDVGSLTIRDNIQLAGRPVDNFQLLLPRQKPFLKSFLKNKKSAHLVKFDQSINREKEVPTSKENFNLKSLYVNNIIKTGN
ncbi:hypothetical protein OAI34_02685 [Emcibacteraceae bacterium]|nr:hypothetical protein [Emcibacteraceae bacterium]